MSQDNDNFDLLDQWTKEVEDTKDHYRQTLFLIKVVVQSAIDEHHEKTKKMPIEKVFDQFVKIDLGRALDIVEAIEKLEEEGF